MADSKGKKYEWEPIEKEYFAGQLSRAEISRRFGPSRPAIEKHMAKCRIVYGSVAGEVRRKIQADLVADEVASAVTGCNAKEAIDHAVKRGKELIKSQRKDISNLATMEQLLLAELQDSPTKMYIAQYQGEIIKEEVGIAVTDRASALNALANVQHKRIQLQRQAFDLDDGGSEGGGVVVLSEQEQKL